MTKKEKQLLLWRILLGVLILCNMVVVFLFSSQTGTQSAAVSEKLTVGVVGIFSPKPAEGTTPKPIDKEEKPSAAVTTPSQETTTKEPEKSPSNDSETVNESATKPSKKPTEELTPEQLALVKQMHTPIRKLAHMLEFGSLATLCFLFLLTWRGKLLWRYAASLGFALIYAATDELHQVFSDGRGGRFSDVLIDFSGAFIACTLALSIVVLIRQIQKVRKSDIPVKEQIIAFFYRVVQVFSQLPSLVSNQISKIKNIHLKKEKENENGSCNNYSRKF